MKKEYVSPEMTVVELRLQSSVLQECSQDEIPVFVVP